MSGAAWGGVTIGVFIRRLVGSMNGPGNKRRQQTQMSARLSEPTVSAGYFLLPKGGCCWGNMGMQR